MSIASPPWRRPLRWAAAPTDRTEAERRLTRTLRAPTLTAALLVVPAIALQAADLGTPWSVMVLGLDWAIWAVFAADLAAALATVPDRRAFCRANPLLLAIVALTPPVLPWLLPDARPLALLPLLWLAGAARALDLWGSPRALGRSALAAAIVIVGAGEVFAHVERAQGLSGWDGIWWAVVTAGGVGYGDITPATDAGRVIGILVILLGASLMTMITALIARRLVAHAPRRRSLPAPSEAHVDEADILSEISEIQERLAGLEAALRRSATR
jgi:voltage-gated potassium channel